jgi:glycosyltransferase involved in cell wall biosynthesis
MSRRLLLVAYHFPPLQGSTGIHRTLSFAKYLIEHDWSVTILTAATRAYPEIRPENNRLVPDYVDVVRAFALDTRRHLSIFGRYPSWLSLPDRWQSWIAGAVFAARSVVKRQRPSVIMSTYPIASAHFAAYAISRMHDLPWIADFRDPMTEENYPKDPRVRRLHENMERRVFQHARGIVVTTPGVRDIYRHKYPTFPDNRLCVIPNGFDEELFPPLDATIADAQESGQRPVTLLHSGLLYPNERNPTQFFEAVADLAAERRIVPGHVKFVFRASGHDEQYEGQIARLGITEYVSFLPPIPYQEALREMASADACMIFQASNCNQQIPAKLYEYLYVGRPIIAFTDPAGDTAGQLREFGIESIARLDSRNEIREALPRFLESLVEKTAPVPSASHVALYSRRALTGRLAAVLNEIHDERGTKGENGRLAGHVPTG